MVHGSKKVRERGILMDSVKTFIDSHYLIVGLILCIGFILTDKYLMPEELKHGNGEIQTVKGLWLWAKEKFSRFSEK